MMTPTDEANQLPAWIRRRDGSSTPFDSDRICQSLFRAGQSLGTPNAFLARELTDAVIHFLAQAGLEPISTTAQIVEHVEKIVRAVGHSSLAHRYAQMHEPFRENVVDRTGAHTTISMDAQESPHDLVQKCLQTYSLNVIYSPDLRSAVEEGLLHLSGLTMPATLTSIVVDARTLGEESWWLAWEPWKGCGARWIVDSPEWLSILLADRLPMVRICERIVALPHIANHVVELHLNTVEPPAWVHSQGMGPLFAGADNPLSLSHRVGCLDMLLDRCLAMSEGDGPAIAWHLHQESFRDATQLARLKMLIRQAVQGKAIRFIFDRPGRRIALSDGLVRPCPGTLVQVGLDLAVFARRPEIDQDGEALLKKLPSLARMAVSSILQKRQYLRSQPHDSPLKKGFLIERAIGNVLPLELDAVVHSITGHSMSNNSLSIHFALQILNILKKTLEVEARSHNLELCLEGSPLPRGRANWKPIADVALKQQLKTASLLQACTGFGTSMLLIQEEADIRTDSLTSLLEWAWHDTSVVGLQLQRLDPAVQQGEFAI